MSQVEVGRGSPYLREGGYAKEGIRGHRLSNKSRINELLEGDDFAVPYHKGMREAHARRLARGFVTSRLCQTLTERNIPLPSMC